MTDTTDIAALKRPVRDRYDWSNAVWRDCDQCGKQHTGTVTAEDGSQICAHCADQLYWSAWQVLAERALDALVAERQRADNYVQVAHGLAEEIAALKEQKAKWVKYATLACDELDKLKGDQVPVALVDERQGSGGFCLTQHGRSLNLQHGTELFTAPQKPVVLPSEVKELITHIDGVLDNDAFERIDPKKWNAVTSLIAIGEIEAAGCIVQTVDADKEDDHQSSAPAVLRDVLTAVSIGGSQTELIDALTAIKPKFGAPGSRDVDVRSAHVAIDQAIEKLSNL